MTRINKIKLITSVRFIGCLQAETVMSAWVLRVSWASMLARLKDHTEWINGRFAYVWTLRNGTAIRKVGTIASGQIEFFKK